MKIKTILSAITLICLLSACTKHEHFHGYNFEEKNIAAIEVGKTTDEDLKYTFGSPTTVSDFGDKTYYYISLHQDSKAFLPAHTITQDVLEVTFDQRGVVKKVRSYTLNEARDINYAEGQTEIKGNEMTPLEQIFSNIGKFNTPKQPGKYN